MEPLHLKRNITIFLLLGIFTNCWFITSNWYFFWALFMSPAQIGLYESLAFGVWFVAEIPTGAIADLQGRRRTLIGSCVLAFVGCLLMATGSSILQLVVGHIVFNLGMALQSGCLEAFGYDSLAALSRRDEYAKLSSRFEFAGTLSASICALVGGYLYTIDPRAPQIAWALSFLPALALSIMAVEPPISERRSFSWREYYTQQFRGFSHLWQQNLRGHLPMILCLTSGEFLFMWGLLRPALAESFGLDASTSSYVVGICYLLSAIIVLGLPKVRQIFGDRLGLASLCALSGVGFLWSALSPSLAVGLLLMLLLNLALMKGRVWSSVIVNEAVPGHDRATALSSLAMITKVPYLVLTILAGESLASGAFPAFLVGIGCTFILSLALSIRLAKGNAAGPCP